MASVLTSITERITPDAVSKVATRLGESDAAVSRGLPVAVASVLASLVAKTGDSGAMRRVYDLATSRDNDINAPADFSSSIARAMTTGSPSSSLGGTLLTTVLGGRMSDVSGLVVRAAGIEKPSSGSALLTLVAPIILGMLGQRIRERGLNPSGFASMLAGERDSILAAAPAGIRSLVDMPPAAAGGLREGTVPPRGTVEEKRGARWLWPVLGGIAAIVLLLALLGRNRVPQPVATSVDSAAGLSRRTVDSSLAAGRRTLDTATGTVTSAVRELGGFVRRSLPGGVTLNVPERGIESRLVAFIEDRSRPVNDTTWFEFDRLNFATGSATILPQSEEQLDNIAAVLKAYPAVHVKIGGYTDNTGEAAANMRLSQARADAVRQALVAKSITASRLEAEGYGAQHPVADNSTPEGRAKNRRIALRVTAK